MAVNPIKVWNGTAWEYTGPVVAAPPVKYQATQPSSPATGDVWVESDVDVATFDPSQIVRGGAYVNEAARSSAITSPVTGMITYVGDTGTETPSATIPQIQAYNGTAWQNTDGLTLVANVNFSGASIVAIDNVFTTTYDNYRVVVFAEGTANAAAAFVLRKAGVPNAAGWYGAGFYTQFNGNAANFNSANIATFCTAAGFGTDGGGSSFDVINARAVSGDSVIVQGQFHYQPAGYNAFFGFNINGNVYDGFSLAPGSGTITGKIRVYGYRNA